MSFNGMTFPAAPAFDGAPTFDNGPAAQGDRVDEYARVWDVSDRAFAERSLRFMDEQAAQAAPAPVATSNTFSPAHAGHGMGGAYSYGEAPVAFVNPADIMFASAAAPLAPALPAAAVANSGALFRSLVDNENFFADPAAVFSPAPAAVNTGISFGFPAVEENANAWGVPNGQWAHGMAEIEQTMPLVVDAPVVPAVGAAVTAAQQQAFFGDNYLWEVQPGGYGPAVPQPYYGHPPAALPPAAAPAPPPAPAPKGAKKRAPMKKAAPKKKAAPARAPAPKAAYGPEEKRPANRVGIAPGFVQALKRHQDRCKMPADFQSDSGCGAECTFRHEHPVAWKVRLDERWRVDEGPRKGEWWCGLWQHLGPMKMTPGPDQKPRSREKVQRRKK